MKQKGWFQTTEFGKCLRQNKMINGFNVIVFLKVKFTAQFYGLTKEKNIKIQIGLKS